MLFCLFFDRLFFNRLFFSRLFFSRRRVLCGCFALCFSSVFRLRGRVLRILIVQQIGHGSNGSLQYRCMEHHRGLTETQITAANVQR